MLCTMLAIATVTVGTVKEASIVFVKNDRFLFLMMETLEKTGQKKLSRIGLIAIPGLAGFVSAADNWVVSALLPAIAAGIVAVSLALIGDECFLLKGARVLACLWKWSFLDRVSLPLLAVSWPAG